MSQFKVYDLTAAGSYLAVKLGSGRDSISLLLRLVGELYLPEGGLPEGHLSAFYTPFYNALSPDRAMGFLNELVEPTSPALPEYFTYSISPLPSRHRVYVEPTAGNFVMKYHVIRVSLDTLTASLLLVDQPAEGDGILVQVAVPQGLCSTIDHFGKAAV